MASGRELEADRAAQVGNYKLARSLLEEEAGSNGSSLSVWVKLSALRKGAGDLSGALVAAERSLAIAPLDFTSLLQRAVLLDQLGDARSGEAFGQALSQAPQAADVPPPMRDALAHARVRWDQHSIAIEQRLKGTIPSTLDDEARSRAERFASNRARRTRHFHQEPTEFHYPGVPEIEFHDASKFPRLARLEAATEAISLEFDALLRAEVAEMIPYIQYPDHVPLAQWKELNNSRQWTAIHLLQNGERVESNARHCPNTMEVLAMLDQPRIRGASPNAMFSLLAPRTRIPPHTGVANTRVVCHLPLIVPAGCGFRVGASTREWRIGEAFAFDDTIEHEAWNESDELRVVLIIDLWQPSLRPQERIAITGLIEAAGVSFGGA